VNTYCRTGANDNASGTTAVLEFARYLGNLERINAVYMPVFQCREKGAFGDPTNLAKRLKIKNLNLYAMLKL